MWVFPKIGGKPPKWMVYKGNPYYIKWMIWGAHPYSLETPMSVYLVPKARSMMCLQCCPWPLLCPGKTIDSELSSDDKGCIGHTSHEKERIPKSGINRSTTIFLKKIRVKIAFQLDPPFFMIHQSLRSVLG